MKISGAALVCLALLGLAACATPLAPEDRQAQADAIASNSGFSDIAIHTPRFDLLARLRGSAPDGLLTVYIEGDGFAWERRDKRSTDPTPINPVVMKMASADPAPAIAYLARPCQFTGGVNARNCTSALWTTARYSEEVVSAMSEALDTLKRTAGVQKLALVGYSGGGTIAALLAQRRTDIVWIKTVSAPLDTEAFTSIHKVTPLRESLNPADDARTLATLPQIHYVGDEDEIVPAAVNRRFLARMGETKCAELIVVPDMDHARWADIWASLAPETPACR